MNTTWFSKNLGDAMLAGIYLDDLADSFQQEFTKSHGPKEMALFTRHESEGRLHCEVVAYFSPASELIAKQLGAMPCAIPVPYDLSLERGAEESLALLFPDFKRKI